MTNNTEFFLETAQKNLSRFCFMVWDFFQCSEILDIEVYENSLRCNFENHALVFGQPKIELLKNFNPKGITSISYDPEWFPLIHQYFTNFSMLDPSIGTGQYNTFLCMELTEENFRPKNLTESRKISDDEYKLLDFRRRILFSKGLGGVVISDHERVIGRAFAPHVVNNEDFSYAVVRDVHVDPQHRKSGYGYDLSSKICEIIFENDIDQIFLWVEERNIPAVKIYKKLGFIVTDKVRSNYCTRKKDIKS